MEKIAADKPDQKFDLYRDIAGRTDGDVYIGVVGPVRTGKSTFIAQFMEKLVLPLIDNPHKRERAQDELPQSGSGRTIMTTQPKFVPNEAMAIRLGENAGVKVRLVDCVGYLVKGVLGTQENDVPRMVRTPWYEQDIPFEEAAELGTRKVIAEHSTIGMVVTTDGSITDLPRTAYVDAEERVISELKQLSKPFIIVLNSQQPQNEDTMRLRDTLEEKYDVPVALVNVKQMELADIQNLLTQVLYEFPLREVRVEVPSWLQALDDEHWLVRHVLQCLREAAGAGMRVRDQQAFGHAFDSSEFADPLRRSEMRLGEGRMTYELPLHDGLFNRILSEECGAEIHGDAHLLKLLKELVAAKAEYDHVAEALRSVRETGYGLVTPAMSELTLQEPEIVRQGSRFGVKLKASAPSLHMIRVDIQTEVSPVVGTEKQSEELVRYLLSEFESDPTKIWSTNLFGKSLNDLVREGLANKLMRMPADAQLKVQETLTRIINEGSGGMICILL